jgi:tetratricopeptide (TPR) repeat protein
LRSADRCRFSSPAFRHSLAAGQEALRLAAVSDAIIHFEKARQLAREASFVGAEFEPNIRDLYVQLGRAYELGGQHKQALAVHDELERLTPKQSWQNN